MLHWIFYPRSREPSDFIRAIIRVFESQGSKIQSPKHRLQSNQVLGHVAPGLSELGFEVEVGKKQAEKIHVPVLFGRDGKVEKSFEADAYHKKERFVLEVEAGRGVVNNQFLKDLFQACMMHDVDYLGVAVRNLYEPGKQKSHDFDRVVTFFDTLYASNRLQLPLKGILIIGY